jgi:hypothetical protein
VELTPGSADNPEEPLLGNLLALLAGMPERVRRLRISGLRNADDPRLQYALVALLVARGAQAAPRRSLTALALDVPLPLPLVEALLELHPQLQQLELLVCDPRAGCSKERPWRPRLPGCLRKLHLEFVDTPMALDVGQLAACCPELQELELEGCGVVGAPAVERLGQLQVLQLPEVGGAGWGPAGRCTTVPGRCMTVQQRPQQRLKPPASPGPGGRPSAARGLDSTPWRRSLHRRPPSHRASAARCWRPSAG